MAYLTIQLPQRPSETNLSDLKQGLNGLADVMEPETKSFDLAAFALVVGFSANALQVVDILTQWLQRTPKGNRAVIRLSDGRELKMEASTDPEDFLKQLKAALKDM